LLVGLRGGGWEGIELVGMLSNTDGGFTGLSLPCWLLTGKPIGQCLMQMCGLVFSSDIDCSLTKGIALI